MYVRALALRIEDAIVRVQLSGFQCARRSVLQRRQSLAGKRRDRHDLFEMLIDLRTVDLRREVGFIDDRHGRCIAYGIHQRAVVVVQLFARIKHRQHKLRRFDTIQSHAHANLLHAVFRIADTGGVGKTQRNFTEQHSLLHHVTRRARKIGHNRTLAARKQVHQRGFAGVRAACNDRHHTLAQNAPAVKAGEQVFQSRFSGGKARLQHRLIHLWNVVVRVIRPCGKVRTDVRQIRTQLFNTAGKCAVVSRLRRFHRFAPLRGDDLHDGFRLRKVHFAV